MNGLLDSRQLRAFCVLARTGSFTQTARELHLTQSGISHSMKALEAESGCRLLDRLGKKVVLTQAGEQLLQHAGKILAEMDVARESLTQLGKWGRGRLRLGGSTTACQHLIPPVLREFKESFPDHSSISEGVFLDVLPLPPATNSPRSFSRPLTPSFRAPHNVVVTPLECQSKPRTQPKA